MSLPIHTIQPSITRRGVLAGLAAGGITLMPLAQARSAIVNFVAIGKDGWLFPVWDEVGSADLSRIASTMQIVNQAVDIFKQANITVALLLTPAKSRIYREFLPDDFKFSVDADRRYAAILAAMRRPGTLAPDCAALLRNVQVAQPEDLLFFKADSHWTGTAAESTAMDLASQIKAKLSLPASNRPGTRLGPYITVEQGKNDLADLLPAAQAAKYPLASYRVRQALNATGQAALIEDDSADTVVIGNSYMQPRYGFGAMLSNQLNRPVSLVWRVNLFGPYQTLLAYLKSEASRRQRPRLIAWQFHEYSADRPTDNRDAWGQNAMPPQLFLSELRRMLAA